MIKRFVPALLALLMASAPALADLPLPQPSPHAMVMQTVGITDISVDYSSPGVKSRHAFAAKDSKDVVVPFGRTWRAGANAATKLTLSRDATIAGKLVPAGTYSLFAIPEAKQWTLIINKNKDASEQAYKQDEDVLRVTVKPEKIAKRERLAYVFSNTTDTGTRLDLEWDETRVSLDIAVDTKSQADAAITKHVDDTWRPLAQAARYAAEQKDQARADQLVDASLAVKQTWYNTWIKAGFVASKGDKKTAHDMAQKAYDMGKDDPGFFAKADVEKALADWK